MSGPEGRAPVWVEQKNGQRVIHVSGRGEHASRRLLDFLKREARDDLQEAIALLRKAALEVPLQFNNFRD